MKKRTTLNLFLLLSLPFSSFAKIPHGDNTSFFSDVSELSEENLDALLQMKSAKGDLIVSPDDQNVDPSDLWSQLDPASDQIQGTSTAKLYANPKFPSAKKEIIVAVIDSGVDVNHEDLQGKVWVNTKETPGDGIDNDGNGYIDDVNGWNFLGNKNGENVGGCTLELTREYSRLAKKNAICKLRGKDAVYFAKLEAQYKSELEKTKQNAAYYYKIVLAIDLLKANGLEDESVEAVSKIESSDPDVIEAKKLAAYIYGKGYVQSQIQEMAKASEEQIKFSYNTEFDPSSIIGDDPSNLKEIGYGNNDVIGPDAKHGTHVAGIIAANRENNIGILGQADSVKIMVVRAVPDGDERDKDVANAIFYAVKNGATVINMSFGKEYSPQKSYVDKAVAYAEKHGVILVHAAGNSGKNTESESNNFPNKRLNPRTLKSRQAKNWIEVGASSEKANATLTTTFSNWGKTSVDLFAPGIRIWSSIPGNEYASLKGTSMAAPEVAGVAALLMSRFPEKSAIDVVETLMTTTTQYPNLIVNIPGTGGMEQASFSHLSKSGGVVNAENAMLKLTAP